MDSSALGADGSALAQPIGAACLPASMGADRRLANCPHLYTALYTTSEKESAFKISGYRKRLLIKELWRISSVGIHGHSVFPFASPYLGPTKGGLLCLLSICSDTAAALRSCLAGAWLTGEPGKLFSKQAPPMSSSFRPLTDWVRLLVPRDTQNDAKISMRMAEVSGKRHGFLPRCPFRIPLRGAVF